MGEQDVRKASVSVRACQFFRQTDGLHGIDGIPPRRHPLPLDLCRLWQHSPVVADCIEFGLNREIGIDHQPQCQHGKSVM